MFRHVIDECIERAEEELSIYTIRGLTEYTEHVEKRLESLKRIREKAPIAEFGTLISRRSESNDRNYR